MDIDQRTHINKYHTCSVCSGLLVSLLIWRAWVRAPSHATVVSLSKKLYSYCFVLVGSRNGFKRDFTIELN